MLNVHRKVCGILNKLVIFKLVQPGTGTECSKVLIGCSMYNITHLNEHALFSSSKRHQHTT